MTDNWKGLYTKCKRFNLGRIETINVFWLHGYYNLINNYNHIFKITDKYIDRRVFIALIVFFNVIYYIWGV